MKSLHRLPIAYRIRFKLCVLNGHNNTDLVIARTSSATFHNDDRIRHPSLQDKIWRQSSLSLSLLRNARVECSSPPILSTLPTCHPSNSIKTHFFLYWHIRINTVLLFPNVICSALLDNFLYIWILLTYYQSIIQGCIGQLINWLTWSGIYEEEAARRRFRLEVIVVVSHSSVAVG